MTETAKVIVRLPKGCKKTALSVDALDSATRDLAWQTTIEVDGKLLLCRSFKQKDDKLMLEIMAECFEIIETE
jgi:hypothetical protein